MSIYDLSAVNIDGDEVSLGDYRGKVLVIVNTASRCGFTPQYSDLQKLYEKYNLRGFEVLGFPCNQFAEQEPGNRADIKSFCLINYGVSFPLFEKVDVKGANAHPIFKYLTSNTRFKGFDQSNSQGRLLHTFLNEMYPESLIGDSIKWNFTKFLIDRNRNIVERFESPVDPFDMERDIEKLL